MPTMLTEQGVLPLIATTMSCQNAVHNARFKLLELEAITSGLRDWLWENDQDRQPKQYDELVLALREADKTIAQLRNLFSKLATELPE